ncbi:hypothetical protein [Gordonia sp. N1V]|uniref:hypothetical protein n=1 Tax=Gordonia sp. N1V TaxID=3034163 RepID=UPI0023E0FED8|nr:hypothetical protein [Gordonia sp. N1V]MDF3280881.1 hypothetical protein [Gordonia sp. N1V]
MTRKDLEQAAETLRRRKAYLVAKVEEADPRYRGTQYDRAEIAAISTVLQAAGLDAESESNDLPRVG